MGDPRIIWNEQKLLENVQLLNQTCRQAGIDWIPVTKLVCAEEAIVASLYKAGIRSFADSRWQNLKKIKEQHSDVQTLMLRLPSLSNVAETVRWADMSLVSELATIRALHEEALRQQKRHRIILMVDLGDRREGVMPEDVLSLGKEIVGLSATEWYGIGVNLTCLGGVIPTPEVMAELVEWKIAVEEQLGHQLQLVSGGNSSSLPLLLDRTMPAGITNLRLGEALFMGRETAYGERIPGMHDDVFRLEAEVIECKEKPSMPRGLIGMDSFGQKPVIVDKGIRRRAILAIGQQDIPVSELVLTPEWAGIEIIGASSDHLLVDVTDSSHPVEVGSILSFTLSYRGLLAAMTSPYLDKEKE
ncbi:MAG: alanine/ornithine racemase family PLP-dependent enzyme [Clostridia bacterium]